MSSCRTCCFDVADAFLAEAGSTSLDATLSSPPADNLQEAYYYESVEALAAHTTDPSTFGCATFFPSHSDLGAAHHLYLANASQTMPHLA